MATCGCCQQNNSKAIVCVGCLNRTLADVRRNQQAVKTEIYARRGSKSVKEIIDAVHDSTRYCDAQRLRRRQQLLNERIAHATSENQQILAKIRNRRNDIMERRRNLTESISKLQPAKTEHTRRSSSLTFLELKESRCVLAAECLNIYGLHGLSNGTTQVAGILVPPLNRLHCLAQDQLQYVASILTQILHHLSSYLTIPLPFTPTHSFSFKPTYTLLETNKIFLGGHFPFKNNRHTIPSLQALSMLVYNLCFVIHAAGFAVEQANVAFVLNMLARLQDSPQLGSSSFGASSTAPLTTFSSLKIPLSVVIDTLKDSTIQQSSSSDEDVESQWEVVD